MSSPRPYARKRGGPPSVTTVLGAMGGKNLEWGASKETALYVRHHLTEVVEMFGADADAAVEHLRQHFRGVWDSRACMGTLTHSVNDLWITGAEVDIAELVAGLIESDRNAKTWMGREDEIITEAMGYIDGLEAFWTDWMPETVATEEVVRHNDRHHAYIGTGDWWVELAGEPWLLDIKTTANQDADKGFYADSWRLQLAAYRWADEIVDYDDNNNEVGTRPTYDVARTGVLHLRGDGGYTLYELRAQRDEWATFLRLVDIYHWMTKGSKTPAPQVVLPNLEAVPA